MFVRQRPGAHGAHAVDLGQHAEAPPAVGSSRPINQPAEARPAQRMGRETVHVVVAMLSAVETPPRVVMAVSNRAIGIGRRLHAWNMVCHDETFMLVSIPHS